MTDIHDWVLFPYRAATVGVAAVTLVAISSGCAFDDDRDLPASRLWESTHFRYYSRSDDAGVCEAVLVQLERHFELMQQYLGFPWHEDRKIDYYKFRDRADYLRNSECRDGSDSCTRESVIFSPHILQDHELIHAYLAPLGTPPAFFVEGIASTLASENAFTLNSLEPWREVVTSSFDDRFSRAYLEGAWFVGYLLRRYGPTAFLSLYQRLDYRTATIDAIGSAFESVYGSNLDSVWNTALASNPYVHGINLWNCRGASLPLDGTVLPLEQACDGSANSRTFELSANTDVAILSHRYFLFAPLSCAEEPPPYYVAGNDVAHEYGIVFAATLVNVPKGKYFVRSAAQGAVPDVGIRTLSSPAFSKDCRGLEAVDVSADEFWTSGGDMKLSIPKDGNAWFVKLHFRSGMTFYTGSGPTDEIQECSSCSDTPICVPLDGDAHPDPEGNVTLRLAWPEPGPGYASYLIRGFPLVSQ